MKERVGLTSQIPQQPYCKQEGKELEPKILYPGKMFI